MEIFCYVFGLSMTLVCTMVKLQSIHERVGGHIVESGVKHHNPDLLFFDSRNTKNSYTMFFV